MESSYVEPGLTYISLFIAYRVYLNLHFHFEVNNEHSEILAYSSILKAFYLGLTFRLPIFFVTFHLFLAIS